MLFTAILKVAQSQKLFHFGLISKQMCQFTVLSIFLGGQWSGQWIGIFFGDGKPFWD